MGIREALRKPGGVALAITTVLLVITAFVALWPVSNGRGTDCGSWLLQGDGQARLADSRQSGIDLEENSREGLRSAMGLGDGPVIRVNRAGEVASCARERGEMTPTITALALISGVALVVALVRRYQPRSDGGGPAQDTTPA